MHWLFLVGYPWEVTPHPQRHREYTELYVAAQEVTVVLVIAPDITLLRVSINLSKITLKLTKRYRNYAANQITCNGLTFFFHFAQGVNSSFVSQYFRQLVWWKQELSPPHSVRELFIQHSGSEFFTPPSMIWYNLRLETMGLNYHLSCATKATKQIAM